jgi:hypothetical protein
MYQQSLQINVLASFSEKDNAMNTRFAAPVRYYCTALLIACISCLLPSGLLFAQNATTLQIIHNAPEASLSPVSVWAGITVPPSTTATFAPVAPSLSFRSSSQAFSGFPPLLPSLEPLLVLPPLRANITRTTSTNGTTDLIRSTDGLRLSTGANFVVVLGLSDTTNFAPNPQGRGRGLNLNTFVDNTNVPDGVTRLIYLHGSTDAPQLDFVVRELNRIVVRSMGYLELIGDFIPTADYTIDVYTNNGTTLVNSFQLPLQSQFQGSGRRVVIAATGFFNPARNGNGASFGLLAVPHTTPGTASLLTTTTPPTFNPFGATPLPPLSLQAVHASADPAASAVGVWLGAMTAPNTQQFFPIANNFPFRTATPAITSVGGVLPLSSALGMTFNLNITAPNQAASTPAIRNFAGYSLQQGGNWAVAEGVIDTTRFARNPDGFSTALTVRPMFDTASSVSNQQVRLRFINSVTDSRALEIVVRDVNIPPIGPLSYGRTSIIAPFPLADFIFDVRQVGSTNILGTFRAEFARQNLGGKRVLIAATGFVSPAANQGGQSLGMLVAVNDTTGRAFMMPTLALSVRDNAGLTVQSHGMTIHPVAPNPVRDQANISFSLNEPTKAALTLLDLQGRTVWTSSEQMFASGKNSLSVDTQSFAQGTYIIRLSNAAGHSVFTRINVVR